MTPKNILVFLLITFGLIVLLSAIFPEKGLNIYDNVTLNFISFDEILNDNSVENKDISGILNNTNLDEESADKAFEQTSNKTVDSVLVDDKYVYFEAVQIKIDSVIRHLEFPGGNKKVLDAFFEQLATIKGKNEMLRIMHYGDSQIETDRISSFLRNKFQTQFGGIGPGFVSAVNAFDYGSPMVQSATGTWKRYTAYGRIDTLVKHSRYGVLANFCKFSPLIDTSVHSLANSDILPKPSEYKAQLSFSQSSASYALARSYSRCRMFYGYNSDKFKVVAYSDEQLLSDEILAPADGLKVKTWTFSNTPKTLRFEFEANDSPEFYGFAFDGYSGVAVDNIAMRGSSGYMFTQMNGSMLANFYNMLNTKLLILQFGGNVVPSQKNNYDFYKKGFSAQLKKLKRLVPDITIIVIGPADMSKKENDKYVTYPAVPLIRDALKAATFENQCVYWDMYEAMGGENSMPGWVFNNPPLAEKDFTHFTPQGAKYIAKMFYNAFMFEYNSYLKRRIP
jgi:hypothetical protein